MLPEPLSSKLAPCALDFVGPDRAPPPWLVAGDVADLPWTGCDHRSTRHGVLVRKTPLVHLLAAGNGRALAAGALGLVVVSRLTWPS